MSDLRISQLPAATALSDTDVTPITQLGGTPTTRRASLAQLRPALFDQNSVHVRDFGAVGNGVANDAPAIQAAIHALRGMGGGVVRFGPRVYRLASAISIDGVAVRLEGAGFTEGPGPADGTWLKVDTTGFTPITFTGLAARGSVVRDIAVAEVHTNTQNAGWTPNPYDWFFRIVDCFGGVDFDNVFLSSVNKGFYCRGSGRTDFRRIRGQVFTCGIEVDDALDVPRLQNIHFWPFWSADTNVLRWQQANGDALVFKRADGPFIDQAFVLGYRSMFRFTAGALGYTTKFYIGSAYADFCRYGVLIDSSGVNGLIANFTSQNELWNAGGAPIAGSSGIFVSGSNAHIQIGNLRIDQVEDNAIRLGGSGNRLDIFALRAVIFNTRNNAAPAIQVDNAPGGTPNRVHLGTPPILESAFANILHNTDGNGVVQSRAPAGSTTRPGIAVGQDNSGMAAPSGQSVTLSANGAEMLRITQGGAVTLGAASGAHALEVSAPAAGANRLLVSGAASGAAPSLSSIGGDGNIGLLLASKGSAAITAQTGGGTQMQVLHQANAVNAVQMFGAATGTPARVGWLAAGADANISAIIGQPKGTGALLAQLPDLTANGGNARGANAVDLQNFRTNPQQVASGQYATIPGGVGNTASGDRSLAGGSLTTASGYASFAFGEQATASGSYGRSMGFGATDRGHHAAEAMAGGTFTNAGDAQARRLLLRRQSTDATSVRLTANGGAASGINSFNLPDNAAAMVRVQIVAMQTGGTAGLAGDVGVWDFYIAVTRGAGPGTMTISPPANFSNNGSWTSTPSSTLGGLGFNVSQSVRIGGGTPATTAWRCIVAADATLGCLAISGTGEANKTLQWVALMQSVETSQ